jgi:hypothetical protein
MSLKSMSIAIPLSLALSKSNSTFEKLLLMLNVNHSNKFIRNAGPTVFANNASKSNLTKALYVWNNQRL